MRRSLHRGVAVVVGAFKERNTTFVDFFRIVEETVEVLGQRVLQYMKN